MPKPVSAPLPSLLVLFSVLFGFASPVAAATQARLSESYGKLPLHFEANQGQTHEEVRFLARGPGYGLYLTAREAVLVLTRPSPAEESVALRMSLVGAAPAPLVSGLDELPGRANYFIGKDQSKWRTDVPTYAKVHYREVYPGIDLVYYGNQRQLEYDFVVAPGADPKKIVLGFKGAEKLEIDAQGDLVLHTAGGDIHLKKPVLYQEIDGVRQEIAGSYVRRGANRIGFKVAAYDRSRPLVIDPVVLSYSTYLGGTSDEWAAAIAVDRDGNAYVTGATRSTDFPTTAGAFQTTYDNFYNDGLFDVFIAKLDATGSALIYSTYLGGNMDDSGWGIAVDAAGNAYVTGGTRSYNFPTTAEAFQATYTGSESIGTVDAFVTKLDPTGSALVYSTFLGGRIGYDSGSAIAVDADGNAYVTGTTRSGSEIALGDDGNYYWTGTNSNDFPTTAGAFQPTYGDNSGVGDAFVTKLNSSGSDLVYSTYLGGTGADLGFGIAVDAAGNAYVTGSTNSFDFPTAGAVQPTTDGSGDAFVTKLNPTGTALVYSTYLGGGKYDLGFGVALDAAGNAYVTGRTGTSSRDGEAESCPNSTSECVNDFPITAGAFQPNFGGFNDAFVTKLDPTGSTLAYSTYLGGSEPDQGWGIAVDADGNAYVTGDTVSSNFPTTPEAFQSVNRLNDAFVTKLDPTGSELVYSTYLGGDFSDFVRGIAVDSAGNVYVTGYTDSTNFPTTPGAFQSSGFTGSGAHPTDAFVAKFSFPIRSEESAATYSGYWTSYGAEEGTFSGGTIVAANHFSASATFSFTGTAVTWIGVKCNVCGIATVSIDGGVPTPVDTFGPGVPGSLTSEPVFSASGLAPEVQHTLVITVTGATATTSPLNLLPGNGHVAVDAFDVTR